MPLVHQHTRIKSTGTTSALAELNTLFSSSRTARYLIHQSNEASYLWRFCQGYDTCIQNTIDETFFHCRILLTT